MTAAPEYELLRRMPVDLGVVAKQGAGGKAAAGEPHGMARFQAREGMLGTCLVTFILGIDLK